MTDKSFSAIINCIVREDKRFSPEAYDFVAKAVSHTAGIVAKREQKARHISGRELIDGAITLATNEYGPLAYDVMKAWGIDSGKAIGEVVFNMLRHELLSKNDNDKLEDFDTHLNFSDEIRKRFSAPQISQTRDIIIE
jgi:uncharacterized repeat protein (TIGR04138 family)